MSSTQCQSPNLVRVWALFLARSFAKLEDLGNAHVGDQLHQLFAERMTLFGLIQVLQERLLLRVILELLNQLFDRFFAIRVRLLDCRMRCAWYSIVNVAAAGFSVTPRYAVAVRGCSRFLLRLILLSTLRIRLLYNSKQPWRLVHFLVLLLHSPHAYSFLKINRRQCVVACDRA